MAEMLVVRRATGDLFAEKTGRQPYPPVWLSRDARARRRKRNPERLTDLPARPGGAPTAGARPAAPAGGRRRLDWRRQPRWTLTLTGEGDLPALTLADA